MSAPPGGALHLCLVDSPLAMRDSSSKELFGLLNLHSEGSTSRQAALLCRGLAWAGVPESVALAAYGSLLEAESQHTRLREFCIPLQLCDAC